MAQGNKRTEQEAIEFIQPLLPLLESGMSMLQATQYAGLNRPIVLKYIDNWESVNTIINTAKMKLIANSSNTLSSAAKNDPKMALEVLKRRSKDRWSEKQEIDQHNTGSITIEIVNYADDKKD